MIATIHSRQSNTGRMGQNKGIKVFIILIRNRREVRLGENMIKNEMTK